MTPLPLIAYRLATRALEPLAPRLLDARAKRGKEDPVRVDERMGFTRAERPARMPLDHRLLGRAPERHRVRRCKVL